MRRGHQGRVDQNHTEVVNALRATGAHVLSLAALGDGTPDLLVCAGRRLALVEVKTATGKLRPAQVEFAAVWPVRVVRSIEEAIQLVTAMRME